MTQSEKNWILSLPTEMKITFLQESYVQDFIYYTHLSKLLLNTPISEGGLSTETINSSINKVLTFQ